MERLRLVGNRRAQHSLLRSAFGARFHGVVLRATSAQSVLGQRWRARRLSMPLKQVVGGRVSEGAYHAT